LIKTLPRPLFSQEKHVKPSAGRVRTFVFFYHLKGDLDQKKTSAGMKQKAKQDGAKSR